MFIIKKILGSLLMPLPFCLLIAFLGLFLIWRGKGVLTGKTLITIALLGLTLMSYNPVSRILNRPLDCKYDAYLPVQLAKTGTETEKTAEYVVVLAGGHKSDPNVPLTSHLGGHSLIRLMEGIRVFRLSPGVKLVLSGGSPADMEPEARVMARVSEFMGVRKDHIIIEDASNDTKDQAMLIQRIVQKKPFILVTSAAHMPRSMALFEKLGMHPIPAPAGATSRSKTPFFPGDIFPRADALEDSTEAIHEYLGIVWGRLRGQI